MAGINGVTGVFDKSQADYLDKLQTEAKNSELVKNQTMDKDAFLRILTTQLKYQDPLNPTSDKEFIGQMAQFSSLEQTNNMAKAIEKQSAATTQILEMMTKLNANIEKLIGKQTTPVTGTQEKPGDTAINSDIAKELLKINETNSKILSELINLNKLKNSDIY